MRAVYDWTRRHPYVFDTSIAGLLGLFAVLDASRDGPPLLFVLYAGLMVPLVWRRRYPVAVFTAVSLACAVQVVVLDEPRTSDLGFLFALYAASAYATQRNVRLAALGVGVLGAALAALDWYAPNGTGPEMFVALLVVVVLFWTLGDLLRTRRAYVGELEERARRLEFERDQQEQLVRSAERARIARELHDVVAHSLSIVVAQADGGRYAGETDPQAAHKALDTIGTTGRNALTEMRRLLGVLRSGGTAADGPEGPVELELAPQPGLDQLTELVKRVRSSGLDVALTRTGDPDGIPEGAQLAAYRVVQEALTNTLKHGGPRARADVQVAYGSDRLHLEIADDGRGASAPDDGAGHGLTGMQERVAVYGGSLQAGPRPGGGFRVVAELPYGSDPRNAGAEAS